MPFHTAYLVLCVLFLFVSPTETNAFFLYRLFGNTFFCSCIEKHKCTHTQIQRLEYKNKCDNSYWSGSMGYVKAFIDSWTYGRPYQILLAISISKCTVLFDFFVGCQHFLNLLQIESDMYWWQDHLSINDFMFIVPFNLSITFCKYDWINGIVKC